MSEFRGRADVARRDDEDRCCRVPTHHHQMLERRRLTRTRIFAPAIVIPNGGSFVWDCYVRDITSNGARLEFPSAPVIPSVFNLTFDSAKTLRACHLVWRIANEVKASFQPLTSERLFIPPLISLSR